MKAAIGCMAPGINDYNRKLMGENNLKSVTTAIAVTVFIHWIVTGCREVDRKHKLSENRGFSAAPAAAIL